jgi:hypothetical protein
MGTWLRQSRFWFKVLTCSSRLAGLHLMFFSRLRPKQVPAVQHRLSQRESQDDAEHDTFSLLHVVYLAEAVRLLLKPAPGHEGFAKRVFGNVQHLVPYEAYAAIATPADAKWMR